MIYGPAWILRRFQRLPPSCAGQTQSRSTWWTRTVPPAPRTPAWCGAVRPLPVIGGFLPHTFHLGKERPQPGQADGVPRFKHPFPVKAVVHEALVAFYVGGAKVLR